LRPGRAHERNIPIADIKGAAVGDAASAAYHVRNLRDHVNGSDVDLLRDLDRIINLDAEVPHGAFDL